MSTHASLFPEIYRWIRPASLRQLTVAFCTYPCISLLTACRIVPCEWWLEFEVALLPVAEALSLCNRVPFKLAHTFYFEFELSIASSYPLYIDPFAIFTPSRRRLTRQLFPNAAFTESLAIVWAEEKGQVAREGRPRQDHGEAERKAARQAQEGGRPRPRQASVKD